MQQTFRASDTGSAGDYPRELEGFLLNRQVEDCSPRTLETHQKRVGAMARFIGKAVPDIARYDIELYLLHMAIGVT